MWRYIEGAKPPKRKLTAEDALAAQRVYDQNKRKRLFQPAWLKEFKWLIHDENMMYCAVCKKLMMTVIYTTWQI